MTETLSSPALVAVTGATGFVGKALMRAYAAERIPVKALTRRPQEAVDGVTWIPGSLEDPEALKDLVADADLVVHAAGLVKARTRQDFESVNATGVRLLADIVGGIGTTGSLPRVIHISSLAARLPEISPYAASKRRGENELQSRTDLDWVILRPPAIYGPGEKEIAKILRLFSRGIVPVPGRISNRLSMLHIDDLVGAVQAVARHAPSRHKTYELHDGTPEGVTVVEIAETVCEIVGEADIATLVVPGWTLQAAAAFNALTQGFRKEVAMLSPGKAREALHPDWVAKNGLLNETGLWSPQINLRDGLKQTLEWCKDNRLI